MFGFLKRKTAYEGLFGISTQMALVLQKDLSAKHEAISLSAYISAHLLGCVTEFGISPGSASQMREDMQGAAIMVFGSDVVSATLWVKSLELALEAWSEPVAASPLPSNLDKLRYGAAPSFFEKRSKVVPWTMKSGEFLSYVETLDQIVSDQIQAQSKKWKLGE